MSRVRVAALARVLQLPAGRDCSIVLPLIVALTLLAGGGASAADELRPAAACPAGLQGPQAPSAALETGRELTGMFFGRELGTLWERFSAELREALDAQGGLLMFRDLVEENLGDEAHVLEDFVVAQEGMHLYVRQSIFQNYGETVELRWTFDDEGVVHGFEVVPG